jgi:hypothetical protein
MWRGMGIEMAPVFTRMPGMPAVEWAPAAPPRWLFYLNLVVREINDPTVVSVGNVPFASSDDARMPPTWREPDDSEPRFTIEEWGVYRYTSDPADLRGIAKQVTLVPAMIGSFLREQYDSGALPEVALLPTSG